MKSKSIIRTLVAFLFIASALIILGSCTKHYTVSFDSDGGSEVASIEVPDGGFATMPEAPTRDGYTFLGWYKDNDKWDFSHYVISENIVLKAKWQINYTAIFDSNGGSSVSSVTKPSGELIDRPDDPTYQNHTFLGWYNGDVLWNFDTDKLTSDITLTAKWIINRTVIFDSAGAAEVPPQVVTNGSLITEPPTPILAEHTFMGWYIGEIPWNFATDMLTDNITLTAKWVINRLVTFDSNGGTDVPDIIVADGSKLTPPTQPTNTDYAFIGWYLGDTPWDFENGVVNSDIILTARWESNYYVVSFNTDGAGEIPKQNVMINGYAVEPPAPEMEGHIFVGWFLEDIPWNFALNKVPANIVLKARWIKNITVSFDSDGGSAVTEQKLTGGAYVSIPADPIKEGFAFAGWYLNDVLWDFENNTVDDSITLKAKWTPVFTVTFNTDGGTSINLQKVTAGALVTEPQAPAKNDYVFRHWEYNGRVWNFATDTVNDNITLKAVYYAPVSVSFDTVGAGTISPVTIPYGSVVTAPTAPTKQNYSFDGWFLNGQPWDFSAPVYESITLTASWTLNACKITLDSNGGNEVDPIYVTSGSLIDYYLIETPTRDGYTFVGWFCPSINNYWNFDENTVSGDITLIAQWREGDGMNNGVLGPNHNWG